MFRSIIIYLFLILVTLSGALAQNSVIMTYNIRYDNPGDSINSWKNRKDKLSTQVLKQDPDILGVQEALVNQVKDLDSLLPLYKHFGVGRDDGKEKGEYSAIYYKSSRYELIEGGNYWLSETPEIPGSMGWDAACTRIVTWVKLKDKSTGNILCHFNTHFDHMGARARKQSARLLKYNIKKIAKGLPVIITGDFNCSITSKPMKILMKGKLKLKDSRSSSPIIAGPDFSYSTFFVNGKQEEIIDHVFTNKFFKTLDYKILQDNFDGRYYSDHLPVVVQVSDYKLFHK